METNYVNEVARGIIATLKYTPTLLMSWGATEFCAQIYEKMPALKFSVNGFLFKGTIVVALNEGADLYEVYCIDNQNNVVKSDDGVYFDELADVIDTMVEKNGSQEEYNSKITSWLNETA